MPDPFVNFRQQRHAAPPQPQTPFAGHLPGTGVAPLAPGAIITWDRLSPEEQEGLMAQGFERGESVPSNIAAIVSQYEQANAANVQGMLPVPHDTPAYLMPEPVDANTLPPAHREAVMASVRQAVRDIQTHQESAQYQPPGMDPSVQAAIDIGDRIERGRITHNSTQPRPQATPYLAPAPPVYQAPPTPNPMPPQYPPAYAEAPPPAYRAPEPVQQPVYQQPQPVYQPPQQPSYAPSPSPPPMPPSRTGLQPPHRCRHCGYDLDRPETVEPTDEERRDYLIYTQDRSPLASFRKSYSLFGGNLNVTFRTPSRLALDLMFRQIAADDAAGRFADQADRVQCVLEYRFVLGLHAFSFADGIPVPVPHPLAEQPDKGEPSCLRGLVAAIKQDVLPQDGMWRAVIRVWDDFSLLVNFLEDRGADDPFWRRTAARA